MAYRNIEDQRAASKKHYSANKALYSKRNKAYRQSIRKFVQELKESKPCSDCGKFYPYYVMDFDHIDSSNKISDINYLSSTGRIGALKAELGKCEIVCSNCHRMRTHIRSKDGQNMRL